MTENEIKEQAEKDIVDYLCGRPMPKDYTEYDWSHKTCNCRFKTIKEIQDLMERKKRKGPFDGEG